LLPALNARTTEELEQCFHDVTQARHARRAVEARVDGIIAVASGAGGHAGTLNPFALKNDPRVLQVESDDFPCR
jgi:NAD(P)H-dependent flavin oxidoreductase YrpB (nitropropane dioxygenase family)